MITKRPLRVAIPTADHAIVSRGSIPIINMQAGPGILIVGEMIDLTIESDAVMGTIQFVGTFKEASQELFENAERCDLSLGAFGICLNY